MASSKPSVFVGSSSEGLDFARAVRSLLKDEAEVTVWKEGTFRPGSTYIDTLTTLLPRFDFAVLVLTPDDIVVSRSKEQFGPRDNVIFELGLFMGHLERGRTFMLLDETSATKVPSDLAGVIGAVYSWPRSDGDHRAAVGSACDDIRSAIRSMGLSDRKTSAQVEELRARQESTEGQVREAASQIRMMQFAIKGLVNEYEYDKLVGLVKEGPFLVHYNHRMFDEVRRLHTLNYVRTHSDGIGGVTSIRQFDGRADQFDLKSFIAITDEGREYLRIRSQLDAPA